MRCAIRLLLSAWLVSVGALAHAQAYPSKTVRVIVPAQAGDTCDILSRLLGQRMGERLNQQFVIDNRPGAGGAIGMTLAAQAAPDGHTIACGQGGNMVVLPHAVKKLAYDPLKDYAPVALMATNYLALVAHPSVPFRNAGDLVKYAKANPGKLAFGSNGEGAFLHFAVELFRAQAGFKYVHVPFKGVPQMAIELMGGGVDAAFSSFTAILPYVKSGRVKLLGVARSTRAPNYPDYPAIAETVPGFESGGWFGLIAPAATPREIVALLNREANAAMQRPDVREKMVSFGLDVVTESPEHFVRVLASDFEKYGKVAREIGLKAQ